MENQGDGADKMWADLLGANGTGLHGDLLVQILVRLPIKSILRFKSVCKAWYIVFSSPIFIRHHMRMTRGIAKMTSLMSLLLHTRGSKGNGDHFNLLCGRSCGKPDMINLNPPFEGDLDHVSVVGSIGGLVCLNLCINATSIVLWNPAIRKYSNIPNPNVLLASDEHFSLGFAYDETTDSYKVIRLLYYNSETENNRLARVEVYSTRTNTWRTIEVADSLWLVDSRKCGVVANGAPCWLAWGMGSSFPDHFVWFDPSMEAFRFHRLPPDVDHSGCFVDVNVIEEHPIVMYCQREVLSDSLSGKITRVDIRKLLKCDDGGPDSFNIEKITVEPIPQLLKIVGFWRSGEIIALNQFFMLLTYDFRSLQVKYLPSHGDWGWPFVYDYTESLVWPF